MAFEPIFNIEGNLLGDPDLRFTPNGVAVCNFRVGINDARPESNNGKQGVPPLVAEVTCWRDVAENAAETLAAKTRVTGKVRMSEIGAYINKSNEPVGTLKVEALEIGPSLRYATATVNKVSRNAGGNQGGGNQGQQGGNQGGGWGNQGQNQPQQGGDPWANGAHPGQQGGNQQNQPQSQPQQGQGGGWGSDQGWGNSGGGAQGGDPWGGK